MTDITEIKRELEALTAKVAKLEAQKHTTRNWPEKIEAGMCFEKDGLTYIASRDTLVCIHGATAYNIGNIYSARGYFGDNEDQFIYLGHARDILTIRTDATEAHEPTGAELVGKVCEFSNGAGSVEPQAMMCTGYDGSGHGPYKYKAETGSWFCNASLAR